MTDVRNFASSMYHHTKKILYVVIQEDMGLGVSVVGVYSSSVKANEKLAESNRYWIEECTEYEV